MICQCSRDIYNIASQIQREILNCNDEKVRERIIGLVDNLYELSDKILNELDCED